MEVGSVQRQFSRYYTGKTSVSKITTKYYMHNMLLYKEKQSNLLSLPYTKLNTAVLIYNFGTMAIQLQTMFNDNDPVYC